MVSNNYNLAWRKKSKQKSQLISEYYNQPSLTNSRSYRYFCNRL